MSLVPSRVFSKYERYIGVPYLDKGRDMRGWDCFGLYCYVLREVMGKQVKDYDATYRSAHDNAEVTRTIREHAGEWVRVPAGSEQEGDGVVFLIAGQPLHCGYVLERGIMLHAMKGKDTCIERYDTYQWNRRIEGFYKWN